MSFPRTPQPTENDQACESGARLTCYRCRKPAALCLCARVHQVDNRTNVVILQHRRERFHAIGTARIARLALARCALHEVQGAIPPLELPPGAAVLFPAEGAPDLAELHPAEQPSSLVVLDGTWHHARRMYLDNPWLQNLPAVRLSPEAPSRYRIRRQAQRHHVSTIESIVAALKCIEPSTPGLDTLLDVFDSMISDQEEFMVRPDTAARHQQRRPRPSRAVPNEFYENGERLVVVYGETAPLHADQPRHSRQLVSWTAVRPATGQTFERFVLPQGSPPEQRQLEHTGITATHLEKALPLEEVARDWREFRRDDDLLSAWSSGRLRMLRSLDTRANGALQLKALWCNTSHQKSGNLDDLVASLHLTVRPTAVHGRAASRLSLAVAMAEHLLALGPQTARLPSQPS
ncbi:MAG: DTW domain-containing protein YfiP [Pseudohongiellaceae bacterium]|jgi:DTW domain-containing protein YfiP